MDLKAKWNKLVNMSKTQKGFKGQGHKLGTADTDAQQRQVRPADSSTLQGSASRAAPAQAPPAALPNAAPPAFGGTGRKLGFSGAAPAAQQPVPGANAPTQPPPQHRTGFSDGSSASTFGAGPLPAESAEPPSEEMEAAAAQLRSDERGGAAAALLTKVLGNIVGKPSEPKYRKLRLQNKKVQQELIDVGGGIEFLQAAGFQLIFEEDGGQTEGYAVFPEDEDLKQLRSALVALVPPPQRPTVIDWSQSKPPASPSGGHAAAAAATPDGRPAELPTAAAAAQPSERRERHTQVLLPDNPGDEVSEEVFKRTPADVKTSYLAARKQLQQGQMLMTRAYRAKLAAGGDGKGGKKPAYGVIRVRLPDGLMLQGEFNAGEQVSKIFEWVSEMLRDPSRTYELISPARRPLAATAGTVAKADLMPSSLLNFRWAVRHPSDAYLPPLKDDWLACARPSSAD